MHFSAFRLPAIIAILFSFESHAQQYGYTNYSVNDGLLSSTVYCVATDSLGRLWFGTPYGVSVFNGNHFQTIDRERNLKEIEVYLLHIDSKGRSWFINLGNELYYSEKGIVKKAKHKGISEQALMGLSGIRKIIEDKNHVLWFLGKNIYKVEDDSLFLVRHNKQVSCFDIRVDKGQVMALSINGWKSVNDADFEILTPSTPQYGFYRGSCKVSDSYLLYHDNVIDKYKHNTEGRFVKTGHWKLNSPINRIRLIRNEYLFILTLNDGAVCINVNTNDTTVYFPGKPVSDIIADKENSLWFTTLNEGIFRIPWPEVTFFNRLDGLSGDNVLSIAGDSAQIWIGTDQGTIYKIQNDELSETKLIHRTINKRILNLDLDKHGNIYAATDCGLYRISGDGKNINRFFNEASTFKCVGVAGERLMAGTSGDARFRDNLNGNGELNKWQKRVTAVYPLSDSLFAIGALDGLYFIAPGDNSILKKNEYFIEESINYISGDHSGNLWVATNGAGVFFLDGLNKTQLTVKDGLLSNSCKHIFCNQQDGSIWVATNKGINKIVSDAGKKYYIYSFGVEDGLPSNDINQVFVRNDTVWAATSSGLIRMPVVKQDVLIPAICIKSITSGDSIYNYLSSTIWEFPYNRNTIEIGFEGISMSAGKLLRYSYRLAGMEKDWISTTLNSVRYVGLPPGQYTFEVSAVHPKAVSGMPVKLSFVISPPFWKTWWFGLTVFLVAAIAVTLGFRMRLAQLRRRTEDKNKLLQSEITSLRAQMNPHFIFNSLNSIQDFIFNNDKQNANEYLTSFSTLIRLVLDNSSGNNTSISKECMFLDLYLKLEQLRMNHKFEYEIIIDEKLNPDKDELPSMVLQPIVENSLIHGIAPKTGNCRIRVKFDSDADGIRCVVEDNGVGRSGLKSGNRPMHHSFGLIAIKERIKLLSSIQNKKVDFNLVDLFDDDGNASGTKACLTIYKKSYERYHH